MAKRTFKQFSIASGGTPQPLIGTTLSAATVAGGDGVSVAVADSSMFTVGDMAIFGTSAVGDEERQRVIKVPDSTHIKVNTLEKSHLSGAFVRLGNLVEAVYVQTKKVNTGSIYIGTQGMTKAGYVNVIVELLQVAGGVQPIDWTDPMYVGANGVSAGDYWVDGTTGDGYLPSLTVL